MNKWRWLTVQLCMAGLVGLISVGLVAQGQEAGKKDEVKKDEVKKDEGKKDVVKPIEPKVEQKADPKVEAGGWGLKAFSKKDSKFYQTVETKTNQKLKVAGQEVNQDQSQTFWIEYTAMEMKGDNYIVKQKIVGVKMDIDIGGNKISYNSTDGSGAQNPMTDFFKALLASELTLTINSKTLKVEDVEGAKELIDKLGGSNAQLTPLLNSILSKDALKQMAEPTWGALPDHAVAKGDTWGNSKNPSKLDP